MRSRVRRRRPGPAAPQSLRRHRRNLGRRRGISRAAAGRFAWRRAFTALQSFLGTVGDLRCVRDDFAPGDDLEDGEPGRHEEFQQSAERGQAASTCDDEARIPSRTAPTSTAPEKRRAGSAAPASRRIMDDFVRGCDEDQCAQGASCRQGRLDPARGQAGDRRRPDLQGADRQQRLSHLFDALRRERCLRGQRRAHRIALQGEPALDACGEVDAARTPGSIARGGAVHPSPPPSRQPAMFVERDARRGTTHAGPAIQPTPPSSMTQAGMCDEPRTRCMRPSASRIESSRPGWSRRP